LTAYVSGPFGPSPVSLTSDRPEYLLGGFADTVAPTRFQITEIAVASDVVTATGYVRAGNIPTAGSLISVQGTASDSGAANVTNVVISAVSIDATTGIGTITYPATAGNQSTTADSGLAIVPQPITYEALANGSSKAAATPNNDPNTDGARTFQAQVFFGSLPTTATVTLQAATVDQDSAYQNLGTVATVVGGAVTLSAAQYQLTMARFLRFNVSGVTGGTSPTIAAIVLF
jgi:hypothetical protein